MSKTNKTTKKTGVVIEWPTSHFTIDDVQKKYPNIVNITLRFRVKKALEAKDIVTIGKIKPAIGRPKLVFARANPSKELLEGATAAGVLPIDNDKATVTVAEVKAVKAPATPTPAPTATATVPVANS